MHEVAFERSALTVNTISITKGPVQTRTLIKQFQTMKLVDDWRRLLASKF
jgi:hypothetical protein